MQFSEESMRSSCEPGTHTHVLQSVERGESERKLMTRKSGFTLIELLVVIAIIAILAAIIFPVFARAKEGAYRGSDITNLNSIRTALQLYRADQGAYPPQLLGYVTTYMSGPNMGQVVPANAYTGALFPRRIDAIKTLNPAYDHASMTDTTTAVWPNADPRPTGSAPIVDNNGDGNIDGADDFVDARQQYIPTSGFYMGVSPYVTANAANAAQFYKVSGFEAAEVKDLSSATKTRTELRYTLFWTSWGLLDGGNANDDPRQLGYTDPPESTVVTWDSYFRDYTAAGIPEIGRKEIILFLGGAARPFDSRMVNERSYRTMP
jgi:prepilin-type N-terminal cleavage/methylation domain-containing protein